MKKPLKCTRSGTENWRQRQKPMWTHVRTLPLPTLPAAYKYTIKANTVAVVSDGSAVLGLGNIGALAAMPVMEGKAVLFKEFGGVNAVPICLDTQDTEEIIRTVVNIAPAFGGINLEDISAPRCFEIETRLKELLNIPVFHDDQHGTAIVVLAGSTAQEARASPSPNFSSPMGSLILYCATARASSPAQRTT